MDEQAEDINLDGWDIGIPLVVDDGTDSGFRFPIRNKKGENERLTASGWGRDPSITAVRGRLYHVVHGYLEDGEGTPATLVVFEWLLVPGKLGKRFREATIKVIFAATGQRPGMQATESLADYGPGIEGMAPSLPQQSDPITYTVTQKRVLKLGGSFGYAPFASVSPEVSTETARDGIQRVDFRLTAGYPYYAGKTTGDRNAAYWALHENAVKKSGLPHIVRTAVLLARPEGDFGRFAATFDTVTDVSALSNLAEGFRRAVGEVGDEPVYFDPTPNPDVPHGAAVLYGKKINLGKKTSPFDMNNLGAVNLDKQLLVQESADAGLHEAEATEPR